MALSGQLCGTGVGGSAIRNQVQVTVPKANCSGCLQLCGFISKHLKLSIIPPIKSPSMVAMMNTAPAHNYLARLPPC